MAKQNSSGFKLYLVATTTVNNVTTTVDKLITEQLSLDISRSTNTIDLTSKDNNGYEEFIGGLKSGEASLEFICDFDVTGQPDRVNYLELSAIEMARTVNTYKAKLTTPSGKVFSQIFNALITKFDTKAPMEDKITCSATFKRSLSATETAV